MRLFMLPFLFLPLLHYLSPANSHPDIILETCKQCSNSSPNVNYTLCVTALGAVPKSHYADLQRLGVISAKLAASNATKTRSKIKKLLEANTKNPYMGSCLRTCLELYSDAISTLKDSAKAIKSGRYDDANIWICSAVDAPGTCEDGFSEGSVESPLAEEDKGFFQLAVIALGMAALLR